MGSLIDRIHRELSDDDIAKIADTYHSWRGDTSIRNPQTEIRNYADVPGFCKSVTVEDIRKHGHALTPGRYVGAAEQEDDGEPFDEKMRRLTEMLRKQQSDASKLDVTIAANLEELVYGA